MMISIAILAILLSTSGYAFGSLHDIARQTDYRIAVRTAHWELAQLDRQPYDRLPPQRLTGTASGWLDLGQTDLVVDSVRLLKPFLESGDTGVIQVDAERGRVQLSPSLSGQSVVLDYRFLAPDVGELHTVQPDHTILLSNAPVRRIVSLRSLRGEAEAPLQANAYQIQRSSGRVTLPELAPGSVVIVDYLGERIRTEVSGQSLGTDLRPSTTLGANKLLGIEEVYGEGKERLLLDLLRSQP